MTPRRSGRVLGGVLHDGPLPLETVRDLIGIARALYGALKAHGPAFADQATKVANAGAQLGRALEKAQKGGPGTWNHRTAWLMAEQAAADLGAVAGEQMLAKSLVAATGARLLKKR